MVSILLTCFEKNKYLQICLPTLIQQNYTDLEIILLDDDSDERQNNITKQIAKEFNCRYIRTAPQKNVWRIPGFALNIGVPLARGEIIIIGCPEIFHLNKTIEKLVAPILKDKMALGQPIGKWESKDGKRITDLRTELPFFLAMHKDNYVGYDETFTGNCFDDDDFIFRLKAKGCYYILTDAEIIHLWHPHNTSRTLEKWEYNKQLYLNKVKQSKLQKDKSK